MQEQELNPRHYDKQAEKEEMEIMGLEMKRDILKKFNQEEEAKETQEQLEAAVAKFQATLAARYDLQREWAAIKV